MSQFELPQHIIQLLGADPFAEMMQLQGKPFRDVRGRKTMQLELAGQHYFIKQHFGVGWAEIVKSFLSLKKPVLSAMTEVNAIKALGEIGVATTPLVGYGVKGFNPATQQSFLLTQDLGDITSLEDVCADWAKNPPDADFKYRLLIALGQLSAKLHGAGLCHRDFYFCHVVLKKAELAQGKINLILIDLHRMLMGQDSHGNAVMKDIAGLIFSAMDYGFTAEDWQLFKQHYLPQSDNFWRNVEARANRLYAKFNSDKFQKRLQLERSAVQENNFSK